MKSPGIARREIALRKTNSGGMAGMAFIFAHFVHEAVELLDKLSVLAAVVRHAQRRFDLRPDGERFVQLCG